MQIESDSITTLKASPQTQQRRTHKGGHVNNVKNKPRQHTMFVASFNASWEVYTS